MDLAGLGALCDALRDAGYAVIGPALHERAIVLRELGSAADLPYGWGVRLEPGGYRVVPRADRAAFAHSAGPQSWKQFLLPAREQMWSARCADGRLDVDRADPPERPMAFLGVRPCDLRAIAILDRVLGRGVRYAARRSGVFIVAVNCTEPGATCFCASMDAGPQAGPGYDIALTELAGEGEHQFLAEAGTDAGAELLATVPTAPAGATTVARARSAVGEAASRMGRSMPAVDLHDLLAGSYGAARWDDVAARCLTCGNCTMACPTCFCTSTEDRTDLPGGHAERLRAWDSCFSQDFSYLPGGPVRASDRSRYRQWLTHKLGTWHDQFGSSGCVGCGRCIVWCPVGIDITEEVAALRAELGDPADRAPGEPGGPGDRAPGRPA